MTVSPPMRKLRPVVAIVETSGPLPSRSYRPLLLFASVVLPTSVRTAIEKLAR